MKRSTLLKFLSIFVVAIGLYPASIVQSWAKEINLNPAFTKKCGITFRHPENLRFYLVQTNESDVICILAYRFKNKPESKPSSKATSDSWREMADGGFEIKSMSIDQQLEEFGFIKVGESIDYKPSFETEESKKLGYSSAKKVPIKVFQQTNGQLFIGRESLTKFDPEAGKQVYLKRIDLLFGNADKSVGQVIWENSNDKSTKGMTTIFEKIFLSMQFK